MSYRVAARRLATPFFRYAFGRRAALRLATARGRSLILLYHRVLPDGAIRRAIGPAVSSSTFRQHVHALLNIGHIVPLGHLLELARPHESPRFSITFDDDHAGYVDTVLPELEAFKIPATFFLSGRALHGLPHYWWTFVEHSIHSHGLERTSQILGLAARTPADLAIALERSPIAQDVLNRLSTPDEAQMSAADIRSLARAGMTIGFHTLHHPLLTLLADRDLEIAMSVGRRELADAAGTKVDLLAYPHGRATSRVAVAAERAGYSAAFIADGRPVAPGSDRFLLARWEPGPLSFEQISAELLLRLLRAPTPSRTGRQAPTQLNSRSRQVVADG
jgi:peptidoglycan/xylan/chitin deacetylase (PgdA/CDA1 family)